MIISLLLYFLKPSSLVETISSIDLLISFFNCLKSTLNENFL